MSTRITERTRTQERDAQRAVIRLWREVPSPSRADRHEERTEEAVPDHRGDSLVQTTQTGAPCRRKMTTKSQVIGLVYTDGWARQEHRERSRHDRRAQTQVLEEAKSTTIPRPTLSRGENLPGRRETATAMQLLPDGTIQRRGTTMVLINGPTMMIHDGLGTDGSTDGVQLGADHPVPATMIGAEHHGGRRHPVPAQEGPRGAWCLV